MIINHLMFADVFSFPPSLNTAFFSLSLKIMDERWESEIIEYGAINITGFRILDTHKRYVKEFLDGWRKLDATTSPGAGKEQISVGLGFSINREKIYFRFFVRK